MERLIDKALLKARQALSVHLGLMKLTNHTFDSEQAWTAPLFTYNALRDLSAKTQEQCNASSPQHALLGGSSNMLRDSQINRDTDYKEPDPRIFLNITHPYSAFICGSQGSGKSHTLSCLLENCLIPSQVNNLTKPLAALVFHHDTFISDDGGSPCEAAFLSSSPLVSVTVLCSPTNLCSIRQTYSALSNIKVQPLRIRESDLNTKRMFDLMAVRQEDGGAPLYVQTVMRILREMRIEQQSTGGLFSYHKFKERIGYAGLTSQQIAPLQQRLEVLESFMELAPPPVKKKKKFVPSENSEGTWWSSQPGSLTIVDLSCPCITPDVACSVFNICLSIFLEQDPSVGRVVALDEAHKYMNASVEASTFTDSLLSTIRLQRHLGVRVIISTQEPTISPKLLDLSSLVVVHRFTSPQWLKVLQQHIAPVASNMRTATYTEKEASLLDDNVREEGDDIEAQASFQKIFEDIVHLGVGQALLFCPSALVGGADKATESSKLRRLGFGYMNIQVRDRITTDGGKSVLAI